MVFFIVKSRQSGQAAMELMASLLLLMVIIAGLLHINKLVRSSLFLHSVIRASAGERAMSSGAMAMVPEAIKDWDPGKDRTRYTADDTPKKSTAGIATSIALLCDTSTDGHADGDWSYVAPKTLLPFSMLQLRETGSVGSLLGAVKAEESLEIEVEPVIRQLVYDKDTVEIKEGVWIPLMEGLY